MKEYIDKYGYKIIKVKNSWVKEHRFKMEKKLKRLLYEDEIIHHKDGDKLNNKISNLEIMSRPEHAYFHYNPYMNKLKYSKKLSKKCANCGNKFFRGLTSIERWRKQKYCSRKCWSSRSKIPQNDFKICPTCKTKFFRKSIVPSQWKKRIYCSRKCVKH